MIVAAVAVDKSAYKPATGVPAGPKVAKPAVTAEAVLGAIEDLHAREQIVTREILAEITGLKLTTIDDRLGHLVDTGKIRRVQRGVFVPLEQHRPARPIS